MKKGEAITVTAPPGDLDDGLFGGVFLKVFEILPALHKLDIYPEWSISSRLYGEAPNWVVIPGVLDLAYSPQVPSRHLSLLRIRVRYCYELGSNWVDLHELWSRYFTIPPRLIRSADEIGNLDLTLGVHYRGNDKNFSAWDSNPISYDDFYLVISDFLQRRPELSQIFVATDEPPFIDFLRTKSGLRVVSLGGGKFHKELGTDERRSEADRAVLDCLLLSRCGSVLATSSALSAFAKILCPGLEIYRCAASKLFDTDPYFPVAYIPIYSSNERTVKKLLDRTMKGDWTMEARARLFLDKFAYRPRRSVLWLFRQVKKYINKRILSRYWHRFEKNQSLELRQL